MVYRYIYTSRIFTIIIYLFILSFYDDMFGVLCSIAKARLFPEL